MSCPELRVSSLRVEAWQEGRRRPAPLISGVSFQLAAGQGLAITGESGSGKTTLCLALAGLLPPGLRIVAGQVLWQPSDGQLRRPSQGQIGRALPHRMAAGRQVAPARAAFCLFQEPRSTLHPYRRIGRQLARCARVGRLRTAATGQAARPTALPQALERVGLPPHLLDAYPCELSTGMCQRVLLAMADLCRAELIIADEPFVSVDDETKRPLVGTLRQWLRQRRILLVLASHDLQLLAELTDYALVLCQGQVAECGTSQRVLSSSRPVHPYTALLRRLATVPAAGSLLPAAAGHRSRAVACCFASRCSSGLADVCTEQVPDYRTDRADGTDRAEPWPSHRVRCVRYPVQAVEAVPETEGQPPTAMLDGPEAVPLLEAHNLAAGYYHGPARLRWRPVLEEVQFCVARNERLAIMGPSGAGKTTLARVVAGLLPPQHGRLLFHFSPHHWLDATVPVNWRRSLRRLVQLVYQDADLALDPAMTVGDALCQAYRAFDRRLTRRQCHQLAGELAVQLALPASLVASYPYRLSGGERKRVAVGLALAALGCPAASDDRSAWRLLVLDEPTSGLDLVLQQMLAQLLEWAQNRMKLSYLVFSHDLRFVQRFCNRCLRIEQGHVEPAGTGTMV